MAETGVIATAALQESFPDAARAALAAYRADAPLGDGAGSRLTNFLRAQTGARSVTPREGDDPDAVLSRAEAAVRAGAVTDALAEIETLPDVARSPLEDWIGDARARLDAVSAAETLSQAVTTN